MENGIGIAEDAKLRERNAVETEALELSINKTVDLSLDGSLCSDGEEVFEEAIEAETPCSDSEDITTTKVGIDDLICSLENKKENLDALHENHKFEEVIGAPAVVPSSEDASAKTELLRSEENRDEKQIASEEIVGDERNGLMEGSGTEDNESAIEDGENHCAAIVDSATIDDETENFNDGNEILDESNQKPVDEGESHQMEIVDSAAIADETGNLNDENEKLDEPIQEPVDVISEKLSHTGDSVAENNDIAAEDAKIYRVETVDSAIITDETANLNDENEKLDESIQKPVDVISDKVSHTEDSVAENDDSAIEDGKIHYTEIADSAAIADETENLHDENEKLEASILKPVNVISDKVSHIEDSVAENNDSAIEEGKSHYVEIVDLSAIADETEKSDESNQKPAGVMSNKMSYVEALTSGDAKIADADNKEALTSEMPETRESNVLEKIDVETYPRELSGGVTNPEKLDIETYPHEMTETQDCNKVNGGDTESNIPENGSLDHVRLVGSLNHEDKQSADSDALKELIQEDTDMVKASESVPRTVFESNGDVLHKNKHNDILCSGHQQEKHENHSANLSEVLEDKVMELEENSCKDDSHDVDQEENRGIAAASTSVLDPNLLSTVEDSTPKPEIAKAESHFNSSNLLAEIPRSSQKQLLEASAEVSTNMVESYEHEARKDENVAKVQEPVSHDTPPKTEQEIKPAVDILSSAISATPAASQNKERGSRPVADTPSSNITSATPTRPAGLGRAAPLLEPTSRVVQQPRVNGAVSATQNQLIEDPTNGETEEYDETREKLQMIRVKFLRLAHRLGQTPHNVVVAQVLYRLGLAEQLHGRSGGRVAAFSFDRASAMAEQLEAAGQEPLDFTCTIMVLGKSGVGKSATINSIFDEVLFGTDAFQMGTKKVQDMVGTVQGIRVRVIDTPGLLPSWSDQRQNEKILQSVKKFIKKTPPDIVLYLDRLDMQSRDMGDMPLLRTITDIFGQSIWFNAIVVLTHAASAPPEGPNGTATSYDMFVTQRSHVVQQAIRQAAGDMRLMNPVSLVENHSACRTNRAGQRVLPNGQVWKPHLLLLSFASKILAEANTLLKLQDTPPGRPFARRTRSPNLPSLLSSLLQSRPEVKLPSEQFGDDDDGVDDDLDECSDSEGESEYDALPPFRSLTKAQLEKLSKVQRNAYYDELEYREKLFMKKQLREERKRRKMMKKMQEAAMDLPADYGDNGEEEASAAASVPVPMPDLALPASFDSDNPTHRYRSLDSSNPWLVRAVLEPNGWDHDIGYDGINVERLFVLNEKVPVSFSGHISKDKKDSSLQMEVASSVKHGKGKATSLGFDMQSVGKDYAYTLRSDTRFSNSRVNKASAGLSATVSGDVLTGGLKLEDKLTIGKRGQLAVSGGAIYGRGEVAYGGTLEATLRDKEHPLGRFLSTLGVSVMDWHGDLAVGCNSQTQIPIGRHTNLIGRFNINNRGSGQFSLKVNSSEQLQIVLIGLIPLVQKVLGYSQQVQYG